MRIAILSRNKNLHSIRRLLQEAKRLNIDCDVINPLDCQLVIEGKSRKILFHGQELPRYDAVMPRIGTSITEYGLAVVRQFESQGTYLVNGSQAIAESRDKLRSLQVLSQHGLRVPVTVLSHGSRNLRSGLMAVKEMPVVLKLLRGTQGVGVMLLHSPVSVASVLDTLNTLEEDVLMQQFLKQGAGRDYRVFVIGGEIVAAMIRTAPKGDFRSNIHRGGEGTLVTLPPSYKRVAVRAAQAFSLGVAGVDIMEGPNGPTLLEVNSSPGFEGIERATRKNVAGMIMRYVVNQVRKRIRREKRRTKPARKAARKITRKKSVRNPSRKRKGR